MKKILKKVRVLSIVLLSIALAVTVLGCPGEGGTPNNGGGTRTATTRQQQIDYATAGSTVTLNTSFSDTSIRINKALTVNGNNIPDLTVIVDSSVRNNVTLRNFNNATITVASSSRMALANRMARTANDTDDEDLDGFKKVTDGAVPLFLENCTIEKIEAEADLALYLENGEGKKSEIDEIKLKDGAEDFSFIEIDEADKPETAGDEATPTDSKSKVEKLSIESDEIEKINLIGGVFDDVDITDDFAGDPIDFKYDKELDDQFGDDFDINAFFSDDSIVEKDIGIVEKTAATGNVYSFTMPKEDFETANGFLTIVFMTPAQKQWMIDHNGVTDEGPRSTEDFIEVISCASLAHPIYMMMPAGPFTVEDPNTTGLKTIYGSEYAYVDYARAISRGIVGGYELEDVVILDKYRNYNKEAVIVDVGVSNATIYVNTAAVRKNDVILCNGEYTTDFEQITEIGTKVSDINLDGYIPYLTFDFGYTWQTNTDGSTNHDGILERKGMSNSTDEGRAAVETYMNGLGTRYCSIHNMAAIYGQTLKMMRDMDGELYVMTGNATYPDVSGVTYSSINTPTDKPNPFL